jgi:membrane AbrB-like protein
LALGTAGGFAFIGISLPLPWVIGPITFNLVAALMGVKIWVPDWLRLPCFAIFGALFGMTVTVNLIEQVPRWLPTMVGIMVFVIVATAVVTWYLHNLARYDKVTSFFSATPGGMVAAIALGTEYGGDMRVISLTQSMRLIATVFTIPIAFRLFGGYHPSATVLSVATRASTLSDYALWVVACVVGLYAGKRAHFPSPHLLGPMAGVAVLNLLGVISLRFPTWIVAGAQVVIGAYIGASFAGLHVRAVGRALGHGLASGLLMMGVGAACALVVHALLGAPLVELILSFAPGGFAEMSLVAFGLGADLAFVIFHQLVRYIFVTVSSPILVAALRRSGTFTRKP